MLTIVQPSTMVGHDHIGNKKFFFFMQAIRLITQISGNRMKLHTSTRMYSSLVGKNENFLYVWGFLNEVFCSTAK